jgi:hypothetical protein
MAYKNQTKFFSTVFLLTVQKDRRVSGNKKARDSEHVRIRVGSFEPVLRIRIHRINMFLGLPDPNPDPQVKSMDPDPDPSIIMQK